MHEAYQQLATQRSASSAKAASGANMLLYIAKVPYTGALPEMACNCLIEPFLKRTCPAGLHSTASFTIGLYEETRCHFITYCAET